jgi:BirA family biotin operon repressor/biotin-[acetyl-CoA-carboxylase] ligase
MSEPSLVSEHSVADAARAADHPADVRFVAVTGSTNSDVLRLAGQGAPAWTAEVAGHQTGGRGRQGRPWVAPAGSSLLVSVLLRPGVEPADAPLLTLAAGLAAADACREAAAVEARCKWPNDVLVGDRKLAGILAEGRVQAGRLEHVVVGLGLNVAQGAEDFPPDLRDVATSIAREGGRADAPGLLAAYLRRLRAEVVGSMTRGGREALLAAYGGRCATIGRTVRVQRAGDADVEGLAVAVGPRGELMVDTGDAVVAVGFGEVHHLR